MKRISIIFVLILCLIGCASTQIPTYLQKVNPYQKRFYANYEEIKTVVSESIQDLGWEIEEEVDPVIYERPETKAAGAQQIMLVTAVRETSLFLGTRFAKMNIYLHAVDNVAEVEIRYLTKTATFLKTFSSYRNDSEVDRIFEVIEKNLGGKVLP